MLARLALLILLGAVAPHAGAADATPPAPAAANDSRAVMTGDQVVQILDETVDWYRTLGTQQQAATQPSDLLILYANRQTADKLMALAFEIARANAELLSSEASAAQAKEEAAASSQSLNKAQKELDGQRAATQSEIESVRRQLAAAPTQGKSDLQARVAVLQAELDLLNARRNLLANMAQFAGENDTNGFGANALKAHIDAIAASIPSASAASVPPASTAAAARSSASEPSPASSISLGQFGIWDLTATVLRLSAKARAIEAVDKRTADLQEVFTKIRYMEIGRASCRERV
mgnify:CR=1 FL=1